MTNIPDLSAVFEVVMHWLDFDAPLNVADAISLQSAFEEAVQHPDNIFVAANPHNVVVIHNHQAFTMKVPRFHETWFRDIAEEKEGLIIDRDTLFVGNFEPSEDMFEAQTASDIISIMCASVDLDRKMTLV